MSQSISHNAVAFAGLWKAKAKSSTATNDLFYLSAGGHYDELLKVVYDLKKLKKSKHVIGVLNTTDGEERNTPLHLAVQNGQFKIAQFLLLEGASPNSQNATGSTPLHLACMTGNMEMVKLLTKQREIDLSIVNACGSTPLHCAAFQGHIDIVSHLVDAGVNVNANRNFGNTPLHFAVLEGHEDVVAYLLVKNAKKDAVNNHGGTALHAACGRGRDNIVKTMVDGGTNVNVAQTDGSTPLHFAARAGNCNIIAYLLANGANVHAKNRRGTTALHEAVSNGHEEVVAQFIREGADLNASRNDGVVALHLAAFKGHLTVVKMMVESGAYVKAKDRSGNAAIHFAAAKGHELIVMYLSGHGAEIDAPDVNGITPLMRAAAHGSDRLVVFLVDKGADVRRSNNDGWTPLHYAATSANPKSMEFIIEHGADINARDVHGGTPLHLACRTGNAEATRLLLEQEGLDINAADDDGKIALVIAAEAGGEDVVKLIVNDRDEYGRTPLYRMTEDIARAAGAPAEEREALRELVRQYVLHGADCNVRPDGLPSAGRRGPKTCLDILIKSGEKDLVQLLCDHGADVNLGGPLLGILEELCYHPPPSPERLEILEDMAKSLIQRGADVNARHGGETALETCIRGGNENVIRNILHSGVKIDNADRDGKTPLFKIFEELASNPKPKRATFLEQTAALLMSPQEFLPECVDLQPASISHAPGGVSMLYLSTRYGSDLVTKGLIEKGADVVNAVDNKGRPLLMSLLDELCYSRPAPTTIRRTYLEKTCMRFVENGVNVNSVVEGVAPLDLSVLDGQSNLSRTMVKAGANVRFKDPSGRSVFLRLLRELTALQVKKVEMDAEVAAEEERERERENMLAKEEFLTDDEEEETEPPKGAASPASVEADRPITGDGIAAYNTIITLETRLQFVRTMIFFFSENGADINESGPGETPLSIALASGDEDVCKALLARGADYNAPSSTGQTPFYSLMVELASNPSNREHLEFLEGVSRELLALGVNLDTVASGRSTLDVVIGSRVNMRFIKDIVKGCPKFIDFKDKEGKTPLWRLLKMLSEPSIVADAAYTSILTEQATLLLASGANVNVNVGGVSCLDLCIAGKSRELVKLVIDSGANRTFVDKTGRSSLWSAIREHTKSEDHARQDYLEYVVASLLRPGATDAANPNCAVDGLSPLMMALNRSNEKLCALLLESGANPEQRDASGRTTLVALMDELSTSSRDSDRSKFIETVVRQFVDSGADVNAKSNDGSTSLSFAIRCGSKKLQKLFIGKGADVNVLDAKGETLAMSCIRSMITNPPADASRAALEYLLENHCDLSIEANGVTALDLSLALGDDAVFSWVCNSGSDVKVNARGTTGTPPLMRILEELTSGNCKPDRAAFLSEASRVCVDVLKADVNNGTSSKGDTALQMSMKTGDGQLVEMLLGQNANVNAVDASGGTVLYRCLQELAAKPSDGRRVAFLTSSIKKIVDNKADTNTSVVGSASTLGLALTIGDLAIVDALLDHGVAVNAKGADGVPGLIQCLKDAKAASGPSKETMLKQVEMLVVANADVNASSSDGSVAVQLAVGLNDMTLLSLFISKGALVDIPYHDSGRTPLQVVLNGIVENSSSVSGFNGDAARAFFRAGANVNSRPETGGDSAFDLVIKSGNMELFDLALASGGDVNAKDGSGQPLLHRVIAEIASGCSAERTKFLEEVVSKIVTAGANVNAQGADGQVPYDLAMKSGNDHVTAVLVRHGAEYGPTVLHQLLAELVQNPLPARRQFCEGTAIALIEGGAEVNNQDVDGRPPLDYAIKASHSHIATLLISKGADVSMADKDGVTPLQRIVMGVNASPNAAQLTFLKEMGLAIMRRNVNVLQEVLEKSTSSAGEEFALYLVQNGADLNKQEKQYRNEAPLHAACSRGYGKIVAMCLEKGADLNKVNDYNETPLKLAAAGGHAILVATLVTGGADVNICGGDVLCQMGPIHECAARGDYDIFSKISSVATANLSAPGFWGCTPLHLAILGGHGTIIDSLIEKKVDFNAMNADGETPLMMAVKSGQDALASKLVKAGADPKIRDFSGKTALDHALLAGRERAYRDLIDVCPVPPNQQDSLLVNAISSGLVSVVQELAETGGSAMTSSSVPFATTSFSDQGLLWAAYFGQIDLTKLMLDNGASVQATDSDGRSILHWLCAWGTDAHINILKMCLDPSRGGDASAKDAAGLTPLDWAIRAGDAAAIAALNGAATSDRFCDSEFPANLSSLCGKGEKVDPRFRRVRWVRISDLWPTVTLSPGGARSQDVSFSHYAAFVAASISAAADSPNAVESLFVTKAVCVDGKYTLRFRVGTAWREVIVDDTIPVIDNAPAFVCCSRDGEIWPILVEKALAKLFGSYAAVMDGRRMTWETAKALADMTGWTTYFEAEKSGIGSIIAKSAAFAMHGMILASIGASASAAHSLDAVGTSVEFSMQSFSKLKATTIVSRPSMMIGGEGCVTTTNRTPAFEVIAKSDTTLLLEVRVEPGVEIPSTFPLSINVYSRSGDAWGMERAGAVFINRAEGTVTRQVSLTASAEPYVVVTGVNDVNFNESYSLTVYTDSDVEPRSIPA